jgi:cellulose 1,4-beta-cellobiosidase
MFCKISFAFCALMLAANAQHKGESTPEETLEMIWETCKSGSGCTKQTGGITMDGNWRWTHVAGEGNYTNCYTGNEWDPTICPDAETCTENCALDGIDAVTWNGTYGVNIVEEGAMSLKFVTEGPYSKNIGSRTFLLDESLESYVKFSLLNQEFTFDVDVSNLPCGLNGALYFSEMDADGGLSYETNECGAAFGTGYCDAQCPHDLKWINGEANCNEWLPSPNDENAGTGYYGSCCAEMDIWEANSITQAYTTHPCSSEHAYRCEGTECGDNAADERYDGVCDKDGCDFGSWRLGDHEYYGPGSEFKIDTTRPFTVVTQFITDDGTENGNLISVGRKYVQDGNVIENSQVHFDGVDMEPYDAITNDFCPEIKELFDDNNHHDELGGLQRMGDQMKNGMVLVMSLWDDHDANMLWLDSNYPLDKDPSIPGVNRGPCPEDSGVPEDVETNFPDSTVIFSKIRVGDLDSTYP